MEVCLLTMPVTPGFIIGIVAALIVLFFVGFAIGIIYRKKVSEKEISSAEDEAKRKRSIDQVDVTGNAAMARVTLDYPSGTFTDYFVLLKVDGEWKIANKVWTRQPKESKP